MWMKFGPRMVGINRCQLQLFREWEIPHYLFFYFLGYFLMSKGRKSFIFLPALVKILSSELNIHIPILFHYFIIMHEVTQWSEHCSVTQL